MSTVPDRHDKPAATSARARPKRNRPRGKAAFDYGYREVPKKLPGGGESWIRIPLTLEDVLHPQFGDVHVLGDPHDDDCNYLKDAVKARYEADASVAVFSDCGIFWDIPGLGHHSPDLSVIFGVKARKDWETFDVKVEKVRPVLIVEITSPKTRVNDVKTKVKEYAIARVPHYVIADVRKKGGKRRITLIAYRLVGKTYKPVALDEHGRAWLTPLGLWLGVKQDPRTGGDRVVLIDPATNEPIGDYTEISRARALEARRAEAEAQRAEAEARRAEVEARRADTEAEARAKAEARVRELEARLRRPGGRKKNR